MMLQQLRAPTLDYAPSKIDGPLPPYRFRGTSLIFLNVALVGVYFALGKLGLQLASENPSASAVWPPTGVAIAASLIFGLHVWPAILIGAFLVNITTQGSIPVSGAIAIGNALEAFVAASLIQRFANGRSAFYRAQDVLKFTALAAVLATMLSATIGVSALCLGGFAPGDAFGKIWLTWWLGDLSGALIVGSLLITWSNPPLPKLRIDRLVEFFSVAAMVVVLNVWVFVSEFGVGFKGYPVEYFAILPLLWAAFRLGPRGATAAAALTCIVAVYGTANKLGPFESRELSVNTSLVLQQTFMATITFAALVLAAVMKEQQNVSTELAGRERELSEFFENAPIGLHWVSADGIILRVNRAELEMVGYSADEYIGKNVEDFHVSKQIVREVLYRLAKGETVHNQESKLRCRDGTMKDVLISCNAYIENGRLVHSRFFTRDITPRKRAEDAMQRAKEQAEAASLAKDRFLAVLSHELRTPLTPVLICAQEMALRSDLPEEVHEDVEMIRRNVELEARLIDDLLDLTRIARGRLLLELKTVDVHECIRNAFEMVRSEFSANQLNSEVQLLATRHHVRADAARLQEVFWNLVKNAVKFTPTGGRITIRTVDAEDASMMRIDVIDTGIGIEPDILPRIFNAFEQGEQSITRRFGGLGLGLAISKALVEMHKGAIVVTSAGKGTGATFTIHLPTVAAPARNPNVSPVSHSPTEKRLSILLVDDHEDTSRTMSRLLKQRGHEVRTAGTVGSALREAAEVRYDLIISDIGLPDGSGHEIMRELIARKSTTTGIALSGFGMEEDVQRSREAGFVEHLTKPVDFQKLCSVIDQISAHR